MNDDSISVKKVFAIMLIYKPQHKQFLAGHGHCRLLIVGDIKGDNSDVTRIFTLFITL